MISGWPVFWVLLLAATEVLLVAATTTTSADSNASGLAPTFNGGAQNRELEAAVEATIVEFESALAGAIGREKEAIRKAQSPSTSEEEDAFQRVPFQTGSETTRSSGSQLVASGQLVERTNHHHSIPTVGRLRPRSLAVASSSGISDSSLQAKERQQQQQQVEAEFRQLSQANRSINRDSSQLQVKNSKQNPVYTNQFVIQVKGGELEARKLAEKHGFVYLNHILGDYYHLEHRRLSKRSTSPHQDALNISIQDEPQVLLLERQVLKRRVKRDFLEYTSTPSSNFPSTTTPDSRTSVGGQQHPMQPVLRPANQPHQQMRPAQQLLRPNSIASGHSNNNNNQRKPGTAHHPYTRPANQPRGPQPILRLGAQHGARIGEEATTGRTQELLEAAASSATLLYQHASAASAAAVAAGNKQLGVARAQQPAAISSSSTIAAAAAATTQSPVNNNNFSTMPSNSTNQILGSNNSQLKYGNNSSKQMPFNDPSWPLMWYLDGGAKNGFDLNVMAAWKMGYTGKGIVITILDDGLEKDHPDLQANYDPLASFDINGDDADPMPRYDVNDSNRHGTRCAGEVAAVPDNNICSIGIAYNSKVGGVRMLDGDVTDAVEARSLGLNNQHIHIYSASWGPDDNGKTVDGPGEMATRAFIEGVTNGRQGLGSIFVFASGNGGREHDNCNCDGYTNSIWTLSISSATENGYVPWYIEACSSTLATTYSSGSYEERQIATTDLHHSCTSSHTGTSASAPLAAGICALVLESNPKLTWRDMQHIVVRTAKPANLVAKDWRTNALKRNVSHAFGYGLMDAAAMIIMAKHWTTVPIQYTCEVRSPPMDKFIPAKGYIELKLRAECANVRYLEHVQSKVTLTASRRGDLHIYLISPHGTRSTLLAQRPNDQAEQGFRNWPFMTVHSWGESPNGIWTLEVHNDGKPQNRAYLKEWTLILYGTSEDPNKHLDSATLVQQAAAMGQSQGGGGGSLPPPAQSKPITTTTPASTTTTATATSTATTSTTSSSVTSTLSPLPPPATNDLPAPISQNPPAPLPNNNQQQYPSVELEPAPPSRPSSHWSFSPPPPPPVSAPGRPATAQPANPATTPATNYVTTFKTIVNNNDTPHGPVSIQTGSFHPHHQPPSSGVSQTTKADFDIVSPATQAPPTPSLHNNQSISITTTTSPIDGLDIGAGITKPSVSQLDIDSHHHQHHHQQTQSGMNKLPTNELPPAQQQPTGSQGTNTNELDGNQIDSKLTKDYRSSGDQSIYGTPNQLLNSANDRLGASSSHEVGSSSGANGKQAPGGGNELLPGSSAHSITLLNQPLISLGCPLLTLLMLIISTTTNYHLTNQLVRLENVRL